MKIILKIIIILFVLIFVTTPNIDFGQTSKLSKDSVLLGLDNSLVGRIPDTAWTVIFDNAFDYIKTGDSLIFSKTFQFTRDAKYLLSDYVAFYWEVLIVNNTEQFVSLSQSNTEYERAWILHFAWLSNPTITKFETDKIVNNLVNLEHSKNKKVAELASEFLFRYETLKERNFW